MINLDVGMGVWFLDDKFRCVFQNCLHKESRSILYHTRSFYIEGIRRCMYDTIIRGKSVFNSWEICDHSLKTPSGYVVVFHFFQIFLLNGMRAGSLLIYLDVPQNYVSKSQFFVYLTNFCLIGRDKACVFCEANLNLLIYSH
ncbi:unnamed protein product [Meloidogyne enterolobii]|uniref:Uncharacterized protein n=1 Tax=Meloidogyne enterolobii TaxID=390850 RepID=A0ACB1AG02_MELEN